MDGLSTLSKRKVILSFSKLCSIFILLLSQIHSADVVWGRVSLSEIMTLNAYDTKP